MTVIDIYDRFIRKNDCQGEQTRADKIANLWQDACRALGALQNETLDLEGRKIMAQHTNYGSAAACGLACDIIYKRVTTTVKESDDAI
jgi:hypothetical protein